MAAPAVEDVVVVPHHQRRHPGDEVGDAGLAVQCQVAFDVEARGGLAHRLGEGVVVLVRGPAAVPGAQARVLPDDLIGVELVAALQEQAERHPAMLVRSEEHTSELQSLMRISYAVFCLKKKNNKMKNTILKHK